MNFCLDVAEKSVGNPGAVCLAKNTANRAGGDFRFLGYDCRVHDVAELADKLNWLPFWLDSTKPTDSSRRLISRNGCGLSRPNLNLDGANVGWAHRVRGLEMKL